METIPIRGLSVVSPLRDYLDIENPELSKSVGPLELYDAVCTICEHYGIDKPDVNENAQDSVERILIKIKATDRYAS